MSDIVSLQRRDVKFGIKIWSDWLQMEQMWDFLRSVSVHLDSAKKKSQNCPIWRANLTQFGANRDMSDRFTSDVSVLLE